MTCLRDDHGTTIGPTAGCDAFASAVAFDPAHSGNGAFDGVGVPVAGR